MRTRLRRFGRMIFRRSDGLLRIFRLGSTRFDFEREVGDGLGSSLVSAVLGWIARTFPEAPPAVWPKGAPAGQEQIDDAHPLTRLLERPNKFFTGPLLWMATVTDWNANGDGYWLKLRNRAGTPVELWWAPSWQMEPKGDEKTFITHYVYTVDGQEIEVEPRDVVHFRYGSDPDNPRKGMSPLRAVLREVFTDDEAANMTASLLRNMGVPGIMVSPDIDGEVSEEDAEETKAYLKAQFAGDKRGEPLVMTARTRVSQFGFSPEQLTLRELRRIPEERVTAALGIPAVVVGFGAGLERSTFTNMGEAREAAYEAGLIPMQRILAEDVRFQLLADFEGDPHAFVFGFDLSKVRVLQEDVYRQAQRFDVGVRGGWVQVYEARVASGLEVTDADRIYLRPANVTQVPAGGGDPVSLAPTKSGNGNGNGVVDGALAVEVAEAVVLRMERERLGQPAESRRSS